MKRPLLTFATLGLATVLTTTTAHADADVNRFVLSGFGADITAESADECSSTIFFVMGQDTVLRQGGPSTPQKAAFLSYWTFDWCAGTTTTGVSSAWDNVNFSANLNAASLSVTFDVENVTYSDYPAGELQEWTTTATVNLSWAGTGNIVPHSDSFNVQIGSLVWSSGSSYQTREADVVLDVNIDGVPASFDSVSGSLSKLHWSNVMIWRP